MIMLIFSLIGSTMGVKFSPQVSDSPIYSEISETLRVWARVVNPTWVDEETEAQES